MAGEGDKMSIIPLIFFWGELHIEIIITMTNDDEETVNYDDRQSEERKVTPSSQLVQKKEWTLILTQY